MRSIADELAEPTIRALLTSCSVDGAPTAEQRRVVGALATGYFGMTGDVDLLEPLSPAEAGRLFAGRTERHRLLETMIVLELARHPASAAHVERVDEFAAALEVDEAFQQVARDYVRADTELLRADYARYADPPSAEPRLATAEPTELVGELRSLAALPEGTLGRAFSDFHHRNGFPFPGEPGGGTVSLVAHDMSHVLGGYEANPVDEVALQAMLASTTDGERHFSGLMASLCLFEIAMMTVDDLVPKVGVLDRPGAAETFTDATRRGASCTVDFATVDHWAILDHDLDALRREFGIVPRRA